MSSNNDIFHHRFHYIDRHQKDSKAQDLKHFQAQHKRLDSKTISGLQGHESFCWLLKTHWWQCNTSYENTEQMTYGHSTMSPHAFTYCICLYSVQHHYQETSFASRYDWSEHYQASMKCKCSRNYCILLCISQHHFKKKKKTIWNCGVDLYVELFVGFKVTLAKPWVVCALCWCPFQPECMQLNA